MKFPAQQYAGQRETKCEQSDCDGPHRLTLMVLSKLIVATPRCDAVVTLLAAVYFPRPAMGPRGRAVKDPFISQSLSPLLQRPY